MPLRRKFFYAEIRQKGIIFYVGSSHELMNKIWIGIILLCIFYGLATGRYEALANCVLALPEEALTLTITLMVSACFWNGMMMIMYDSGLIDILAKALDPLLSFIMPTLKDEKAKKFISTNIAANMFGLGFAATPAGLNGIKRLQEISPESDKRVASDDMVTFLVLNTAGVTLIPTTVIAIRQAYGASNPTDFVIFGIIGTICSCIAGLIADRIYRNKNRKRQIRK